MATADNVLSAIDHAQFPKTGSREVLIGKASNEFVFAVVGHVGSGTSMVAKTLQELLRTGIDNQKFDTELLKARHVIEDWAHTRKLALPPTSPPKLLVNVSKLQDYGDQMRGEKTQSGVPDHAAIARGLVLRIRRARARKLNLPFEDAREIPPDGSPRAYILDCIRHPAEASMLRRVYEDAFILIGVVCEEEKRIDRLGKKYRDAGRESALEFMRRDADAREPNGQHVADAFHLSDYFVDNTADRTIDGDNPNPNWDVVEKLSRLVKIVLHSDLVRPTISETAMHHAYSVQMRSACLSRQVGSALVDKAGNIIATGTNEVPKAGGGVYGESFEREKLDARCAMFADPSKRYCSNTREQNSIINDLIQAIPELRDAKGTRGANLPLELRKTRISELLEFSRAVHAEMDALLSAARKGVSIIGTRLFVTAFPCHYCARHIVAGGIDEVQYIEPYPKSQALKLHNDAIQVEHTGWTPPSDGGDKVLFRPFSGAAPRLYRRAFMKDRDLKNKISGIMDIQQPEWGLPWHLPRSSYIEIEAELAREEARDERK